jgi:hypothetical protein
MFILKSIKFILKNNIVQKLIKKNVAFLYNRNSLDSKVSRYQPNFSTHESY